MDFIPAKTILSGYSSNNSWFGANYNMNIYKGCSHGCIYCDSRSECYRVDTFDTVRAKQNALLLIDRELTSKRKTGVVGMGAMSDPYNPQEEGFRFTRGALELLNRHHFGVVIATKSDLIVRDIDILREIASHSPVLVKVTITTADDDLRKKIEPNGASTGDRFTAIKRMSEKGVFSGVLLMPVLPFINDTIENITTLVKLAHENGAKFIFPAFGVTLRQNQREWFYQKLDASFPNVKQKYITHFGSAYECRSTKSKELWSAFQSDCTARGILYKMKDIIKKYKHGYGSAQLSLFPDALADA
jgi:DNA repair photolyase